MQEILGTATTRAKKIAFLLISSFGIVFSNSAHAGAPAPVQCNKTYHKTPGEAHSGPPTIVKFNGYDNWDSMQEVYNAYGRQERFWLDRVNESANYGRIRHTWATTPCSNFAWVGHEDFAGGLAKKLVAARDAQGRLVVVHIGTDDALYWRSQMTPGGAFTSGWKRLEIPQDGFSSISAKVQTFQSTRIFGTIYNQLIFLVSGWPNSSQYELFLDHNNSKAVLCNSNKLMVPAPGSYDSAVCAK